MRLVYVKAELEPEELERLRLCTACGECIVECPVFKATGNSKHLPVNKGRALRRIVERSQGIVSSLQGQVPLREYFMRSSVSKLYECTLCGACTEQCKFDVKPDDLWYQFRRIMYENGFIPEGMKVLITAFKEKGDPYGMGRKMRLYWAKRAKLIGKIPINRKAKTVYFVGCTTAFTRINRVSAVSMAQILNAVGEEWTLLGDEEVCCGAPWLMIGDVNSAKESAKRNVEAIERLGAERVVTTCPTCFKQLKVAYPKLLERELGFEVIHATQLISSYLMDGMLSLREGIREIVYHDPCELARQMGVIEEPRFILTKLGVLKELEKRGLETQCCGGGGFLRAINEEISVKVAQLRVNQALETGAGILATSCPSCKMNLSEGAKVLNTNIDVVDLVEVVARNIEV
ncbi:MAG: hypothetical protein DRN90_03780 [Thermoproteota archaeon]|nr:MAG: hypothetical protein DRN90_03780 [Candidatus Korarchaeota archaeon]RLG48564.1 MAG: hypothetical protein DRN92_00710 [Candidatus Korarchaeota archaeon]